jgi:hypothetical protein
MRVYVNARACRGFMSQQRHLSRALYAGVVNVPETAVATFATYDKGGKQGLVWDLKVKKPRGGEFRIDQCEPEAPQHTFGALWTEWMTIKASWNFYKGAGAVAAVPRPPAPPVVAPVRALLHVYQGPFTACKEFLLS